MMKCLAQLVSAPVMLVASAIAPHAEQCPVFVGTGNYICETRIGSSPPTFPLSIRRGDVAGAPAYELTSGGGSSTLVIGKTTESTLGGKTTEAMATCGTFQGQKDPTVYDAVVLREQIKGTPASSTTYFYPVRKGIVRISFGPAGINGRPTSYNVCHPVTEGKKAAPAKPASPPPAKPAGTP